MGNVGYDLVNLLAKVEILLTRRQTFISPTVDQFSVQSHHSTLPRNANRKRSKFSYKNYRNSFSLCPRDVANKLGTDNGTLCHKLGRILGSQLFVQGVKKLFIAISRGDSIYFSH